MKPLNPLTIELTMSGFRPYVLQNLCEIHEKLKKFEDQLIKENQHLPHFKRTGSKFILPKNKYTE